MPLIAAIYTMRKLYELFCLVGLVRIRVGVSEDLQGITPGEGTREHTLGKLYRPTLYAFGKLYAISFWLFFIHDVCCS